MNEQITQEDGIAIYENNETQLRVYLFVNNGGALLVKFSDTKFFFDYGKKVIKDKRKMGHLTILKK